MTKAHLLSEQLPFEAQISDGIIRLKDKGFLACLAYRGVDPESMSEAQLGRYAMQISDILKRCGDGWTIQAEARRVAINPYTEAPPEWPATLPGVLDALRRQDAQMSVYFETRYVLSLSWLPPLHKQSGWSEFFWESSRAPIASDDVLEAEFDMQVNRAMGALAAFLPECYRLTGSALLTYLHESISTRSHPVVLEALPAWLDIRLATEPLAVGTQMTLGDTHHVRVIGVRAYPEFTWSALLSELDACPFEYRFCTRWVRWEKSKALRTLRLMQASYHSAEISVFSRLMRRYDKSNTDPPRINEDAKQKALELGSEVEAASRDLVGYGEWTCSVIVMDRDERQVQWQAEVVTEILNRLGFLAVIEGVNAADAWLAAVPGDRRHNPVAAPLHSLHAANLMPLTSVWSGLSHDEKWGKEPLMVTAAAGLTPFRVVLHEGPEAAGHTEILGPTGAGKTVLLASMMYNLMRYPGMRVVAFDRSYGLYAPTRLAGGSYDDMGAKLSTGDGALQPLSRLDQPGELSWMQGWLERLLAADGVRLSPEQGQALYAGLSEVAAMDTNMRTMTTLRFQVQDHEIRAALTAYTLEGVWGVLFDGAEDQFSLSKLHTFEMGALLQSEKIAGAVISWMLHRLDDFEGEPMAILIDELSFYLAHPQFREALVDWIKTARKKNWAVIGATQSIADVDLSEVASVLSEAFPNRIFLPNDRATENLPRLMYQAYGLSDAEIERLAASTPRQDYYWSSRQGKRLFQLRLSPLERAVLAGNAVSERQRLQALESEGDTLVVDYLRRQGFDALADAIEAPEPEPEEITVPSCMPKVAYRNKDDEDKNSLRHGNIDSGQSYDMAHWDVASNGTRD